MIHFVQTRGRSISLRIYFRANVDLSITFIYIADAIPSVFLYFAANFVDKKTVKIASLEFVAIYRAKKSSEIENIDSSSTCQGILLIPREWGEKKKEEERRDGVLLFLPFYFYFHFYFTSFDNRFSLIYDDWLLLTGGSDISQHCKRDRYFPEFRIRLARSSRNSLLKRNSELRNKLTALSLSLSLSMREILILRKFHF